LKYRIVKVTRPLERSFLGIFWSKPDFDGWDSEERAVSYIKYLMSDRRPKREVLDKIWKS